MSDWETLFQGFGAGTKKAEEFVKAPFKALDRTTTRLGNAFEQGYEGKPTPAPGGGAGNKQPARKTSGVSPSLALMGLMQNKPQSFSVDAPVFDYEAAVKDLPQLYAAPMLDPKDYTVSLVAPDFSKQEAMLQQMLAGAKAKPPTPQEQLAYFLAGLARGGVNPNDSVGTMLLRFGLGGASSMFDVMKENQRRKEKAGSKQDIMREALAQLYGTEAINQANVQNQQQLRDVETRRQIEQQNTLARERNAMRKQKRAEMMLEAKAQNVKQYMPRITKGAVVLKAPAGNGKAKWTIKSTEEDKITKNLRNALLASTTGSASVADNLDNLSPETRLRVEQMLEYVKQKHRDEIQKAALLGGGQGGMTREAQMKMDALIRKEFGDEVYNQLVQEIMQSAALRRALK